MPALRAGARERVVLPQDRGLEVSSSWPGWSPSSSLSLPPDRPVDLERFRLPARAVEREHQQRGRALLVRMLGDERLELADELRVTPELELGVDALDLRRQS